MVSLARRLFHQKRVGHAGTLDPLAEGVLPLLLGKATRLASWVSEDSKAYYAEILLGRVTTTDDLEGEIVVERVIPDISDEQVSDVLRRYEGEIEQRPPAYSAIKTQGVTAYKRARRGETVELPPRRVRIDSIQLLRRQHDRLAVSVHCGTGTYIRSLARDIGEEIGCGGTIARLVRLRVGDFTLQASVTPDELRSASDEGVLGSKVLPPDTACAHLPAMVLDASRTERARKGQGWPAEPGESEVVRVYDLEGEFMGLARREADRDG